MRSTYFIARRKSTWEPDNYTAVVQVMMAHWWLIFDIILWRCKNAVPITFDARLYWLVRSLVRVLPYPHLYMPQLMHAVCKILSEHVCGSESVRRLEILLHSTRQEYMHVEIYCTNPHLLVG